MIQTLSKKNINSLNDDCLINIFKFLPIEDKLKIEIVYSKWNTVGKLSWTNINSLNIGKSNYSFIKNCNEKDKNVSFFLTF